LAGGNKEGGGGLFVSYDSGYNWEIMGTDIITNPDVITFAIKPLAQTPEPTKEYIFIGLSSGAVYRTDNNGKTWYECGQSGISHFPFNINPGTANSLPYSFFTNSTYKDIEVNGVLKCVKKDVNSSSFSRVIVGRKEITLPNGQREGGFYYSDNFFEPIVPNAFRWKSYK
jgi:hypothetical protein